MTMALLGGLGAAGMGALGTAGGALAGGASALGGALAGGGGVMGGLTNALGLGSGLMGMFGGRNQGGGDAMQYLGQGARPPAHLSGAELGPETYNMYKSFLDRYSGKMVGYPEDIYSDTSPASRLASDEYNYRINSAQPYIQNKLETMLGEGKGGNTGAKYGSAPGSLASTLRQVQNSAQNAASTVRQNYGNMITGQVKDMRRGSDAYNRADANQMNTFANFMRGINTQKFDYTSGVNEANAERDRSVMGAGMMSALEPMADGVDGWWNRGKDATEQKTMQQSNRGVGLRGTSSGLNATQKSQLLNAKPNYYNEMLRGGKNYGS